MRRVVATLGWLAATGLAACGGAGSSATPATTGAHETRPFALVPPSAIQAAGGRVSVFPAPGTLAVSPRTEISFRGVAPGTIGHVKVVGSVTGAHAGRLAAHRDRQGASFVPAKAFAPGETVTVTTSLRVRTVQGRSFSYTVARPAVEPPPKPRPPKKEPTTVETFQTLADLEVTPIEVTTPADGAADGLVFVGPKGGAGRDGLELLDSQGRIVWFSPAPAKTGETDFREQTYKGKPVLTWWQGRSAGGHGYGVGVIADDHYRRIATVKAGNGYKADLHEFELTPRGTAFVTVYDVVRADLTSIGGRKDGIAIDGIVQEVEIGTGRVLFEWHSLGTVRLTDSYEPKPETAADPYDFIHVNSVTSGSDGNVLVSGRGTHALYELDGRTAAILWRLGGKSGTVAEPAEAATHSQHDAKWLDANTISIFDNGRGVGEHNHEKSRAIVVRLDAARKHATLVTEYDQPDGGLFASQGSAQRLPNGDFFVGWGEGPYVTEFSPDGKVVFGLHFVSGQSYRAYRFPWVGHPDTKPLLTVQGGTAYASWNGATQVAQWQLVADGKAATPVPWVGLETAIPVPDGATALAVRALDADGRVLATSAVAG